jgi:hypothetical protein
MSGALAAAGFSVAFWVDWPNVPPPGAGEAIERFADWVVAAIVMRSNATESLEARSLCPEIGPEIGPEINLEIRLEVDRDGDLNFNMDINLAFQRDPGRDRVSGSGSSFSTKRFQA